MLNITKKDVVAIGSIAFGIAGYVHGYICDKRLREWVREQHSKHIMKYESYCNKNYHVIYQTGESSNPIKKIAFEDLGCAKKILSDMEDYIKMYTYVSVSDYYQLIGVKCTEIDFNFGWKDLSSARIVYDNSAYGYVIIFPKVVPLE